MPYEKRHKKMDGQSPFCFIYNCMYYPHYNNRKNTFILDLVKLIHIVNNKTNVPKQFYKTKMLLKRSQAVTFLNGLLQEKALQRRPNIKTHSS